MPAWYRSGRITDSMFLRSGLSEIVSSTGGKGGTCFRKPRYVSPSIVTFTLQNWNVSQTVTVTAYYDNFVEPSIHHSFMRHDFVNKLEDGRVGDRSTQ